MDVDEFHGCATPDPRNLRLSKELTEAALAQPEASLNGRDDVSPDSREIALERRNLSGSPFAPNSPLEVFAEKVSKGDPGGWDDHTGSSGWPDLTCQAAQAGTMHELEAELGVSAHPGFFDSSLEHLFTVSSGDLVRYRNTYSGFSGRVDQGSTMEELVRWREENLPWGPHTTIGPIGVEDAEPGDALEIRILRVDPIDHGVNYCMPAHFGTGALPHEHPEGAIQSFELDARTMSAELAPGVRIPLAPFPGILGVSPGMDGKHSSIPPGPFGGNLDLRELTVGSRLYVPVQRSGAGVWISDFHAAQGDGEVNLTAIETAAREARIQIVLHKRAGLGWPFAETPRHWIAIGLHASLDNAIILALRQLMRFLTLSVGLNPYAAYALAGIGASFRVTQIVNQTCGVHAMLPKSLFAPDLRNQVSPVATFAP